MSEMTEQMYIRYWNELIAFMKKRKYLSEDWHKALSNTTRQRIYTFPNMGDELRISAGASPGKPTESPYIQVDLTANPNPTAKSVFLRLHEQRGVISREIREINSDLKIEWEQRDEKEESWVKTRKYAVPQEEKDWRNQHEWLSTVLVAFDGAFRKRML